MKVVTYTHHGNMVAANAMFVDQHRKMCLCFFCAKFNMNDPERKCPIANELYELCVKHKLVTPVLECPVYMPDPKVDHSIEPDLPLPQWFKDKYPHTYYLINRGEFYFPVSQKELYFPDVYAMIRENEIKKGNWTTEDEKQYNERMAEWKESH